MTLRLFDTHAHLNSETFSGDIDRVVDQAKDAGVVGIAVIGIDVATSHLACELADQHPGFLHAVVGIQPNCIGPGQAASDHPPESHHATENATTSPTTLTTNQGTDDLGKIDHLASHPGVVAIGETGLDCYWDDTPIDLQTAYFDRHLEMCRRRDLPVVIHMRESCDRIIDQLKKQTQVPRGIMHSFTGNLSQARECLDLGLMISFAGMVTFKKSHDLRRVAAAVPEDRLLVETDAPYLSPEPLRGKRPNVPARVQHTLRCLADVRGVSPEHLSVVTTRNAYRIFGIQDAGLDSGSGWQSSSTS